MGHMSTAGEVDKEMEWVVYSASTQHLGCDTSPFELGVSLICDGEAEDLNTINERYEHSI
jgi:Rieske Fe-S protein